MKFLSFLLSFVIFVSTLSAQVPSAQIKIREKSGFLGMGGPRFIELRMSNETNQLPLTDENVNAGGFYYFLSMPVGDWLFDSDFVEEELVKLSMIQGEQKFTVEWKNEFKEGDSTLLIGFAKRLRLDQPIRIEFQEGEVSRLIAVGDAPVEAGSADPTRQAVAVSEDFQITADSIDALTPAQQLEQVIAVGNAAGDGARIALLNKGRREEAAQVARWTEHVTSPLESEFQEQFVAALSLPHASHPFPHVQRMIAERRHPVEARENIIKGEYDHE